jgi:hypothetical protein
MTYDIGTYIDLTYLNKNTEPKEATDKPRSLHDIGTQFIFNLTPEGIKAAVRVPVAFA